MPVKYKGIINNNIMFRSYNVCMVLYNKYCIMFGSYKCIIYGIYI